MSKSENEIEVVDAVSTNALQDLERASIDMQIATAHKFRRSIARFKENALALVQLDEETAASCLYRRPVGKDKDGKEQFAEGMSIRMAEIVAGCYGNLRVGSRTIESTPRYVVAQGVAHDLETNYLSTAECKEATIDRYGRPYSERMRIVIEKAANAKAMRDAIFRVVPRANCKFLQTAAKELLFGNASSITKWRDRIAAWVKTLGIDEKRVWNVLGIEGAADLKQSEIEMLIGLQNALKSGDITLDDAFPEIVKEGGGRFQAPRKKGNAPATDTVADKYAEYRQLIEDGIKKTGAPMTCKEVIAYVEKNNIALSLDTDFGKLVNSAAEQGLL